MQKNFYLYCPPKQQINISQYIKKFSLCEWKLDDKTLDSIQIKMLMIENEYYKNKCNQYELEINKMQTIIKRYERDNSSWHINEIISSLD
jgi:hypothetical protein